MTGAAAFVPVSLPGPTGLITNIYFRSMGLFPKGTAGHASADALQCEIPVVDAVKHLRPTTTHRGC